MKKILWMAAVLFMAAGLFRMDAHAQSIQNAPAVEKPYRAAAVSSTLNAVTRFAPSLLVSRSDKRLEQIVPPEIIIVTKPA